MKTISISKLFLALLSAFMILSCSQKKNDGSENLPAEGKKGLSQEEVLKMTLDEYLEENPDFPGFYSNGDGEITEIRIEGDKVYQIKYESKNGEYSEESKAEVIMSPSYGDPKKMEPAFYNPSGILYHIYLNVSHRYDSLELAVMANYEHDYGPGIHMKSVTATSVLGEKYSAENLIDGSWKSWAEGEDGSGIGTKIAFEFERPYHFANYTNYACIDIVNGYGDLKHFQENNRVREMNLWIDDDPVPVKITLCDCHVSQTIVLREYIGDRYVSKLTFEILSVYPGSKYDDTCIAEIHLGSYLEDDYIMPLDPYFAELIYAYCRDLKNDTENLRFNDGHLEMFYDNRHDAESGWMPLTQLPPSSIILSRIEFDFDGDTPIIVMPGAVQNQDDIDANWRDFELDRVSCKPLYKDYKLYAYKNGGWKEYKNPELTAEIDKVLSEHKGEYFDFSANNAFSRIYSDVNDGEDVNYSMKTWLRKNITFDFYREKCLLSNIDKNEGIECYSGKVIFCFDGKKYVTK
ncbi:MAG: hypothetical protein J6Y16_08660 [Treponema sp.]|nr:hypothetical protein [Treponema sp.]